MKKTNSQSMSQLSLSLSSIDLQRALMDRAKNAVLATAVDLMEQEILQLCGKPFARKTDKGLCHRGGSDWTSLMVDGAKLPVTLPITSMKSFSPDEIVNNVPKLKALLLLKNLLQELQSSIDNQKDLRKLIQELYTKPEVFSALRGQLKEHDGFKLPARSTTNPA